MVEFTVSNPLYPETKDTANSEDSTHNIELKTIKMSISVLLPSAILLILSSSVFISYPITIADQKIVEDKLHEYVGIGMWLHYFVLLLTAVFLFRKSYKFLDKMRTRSDEINMTVTKQMELQQSLMNRTKEIANKNIEETT